MTTNIRLGTIGILLVAIITLNSCTKEELDPNSIPSVTVVEEIIGMTGKTINIDATASDPDNNPISFSWTIKESPDNSSATITDEGNSASFTTDVAGLYEVEVTATNEHGGSAAAKAKLYIGGVLPSSLTTDTTLPNLFEDEKYPDYYATSNLQATAGLTLLPGVVIEVGADLRLWFSGNSAYLNAEGTTEKNIIFRGIDKVKGSWRLIHIGSNNVKNKLTYVQIMHTGSAKASGQKTAVLVQSNVSAKLSIKNTSISLSDGYAIYVDGNNGVFPEFSSNNFSDNTLAPMRIGAEALLDIDKNSVYTDNGIQAIEVASGTNIRFDNGGIIKEVGLPYHFYSSAELRSDITFEAGVTCLFNAGLRLWVTSDGAIIADGTADDKITFSGLTESPGAWLGIELASPSTLNEINYGIISYGGDAGGRGANIYMFGSTPGSKLILTNSKISDSETYGIRRAPGNTQLTEDNNVYENNAAGDLL
ncbi:MAG: PKD domain-containing protein [Bacteroidales bacterium]|nr:PKD domain-containing protein [Bacteroidales bacterium]